MTTVTGTETLEEIADRLVDEHDCHCCVTAEALTASYAKLRADVLSALRNERTRAARIIKEHRESDICRDNCWTTITNQILGKDGNKD